MTSRLGTTRSACTCGNQLSAVVVGGRKSTVSFSRSSRKSTWAILVHADFGVSHGRSGVTVDRTKVALPVDQRIAHARNRLGHPDDGFIDRGVAVGVVLTNHVTDHTGRLFVGLVPVIAESSLMANRARLMHRLEPVTHVRQVPVPTITLMA